VCQKPSPFAIFLAEKYFFSKLEMDRNLTKIKGKYRIILLNINITITKINKNGVVR